MTSALSAVPWRTTSCRCGGSTSSRRSRSWRSTAPCWPQSRSSSRCKQTCTSISPPPICLSYKIIILNFWLFSGLQGMWINLPTTWWKMPRLESATVLITCSKVTPNSAPFEMGSACSTTDFFFYLPLLKRREFFFSEKSSPAGWTFPELWMCETCWSNTSSAYIHMLHHKGQQCDSIIRFCRYLEIRLNKFLLRSRNLLYSEISSVAQLQEILLCYRLNY